MAKMIFITGPIMQPFHLMAATYLFYQAWDLQIRVSYMLWTPIALMNQ
jgi:hypothetical protein